MGFTWKKRSWSLHTQSHSAAEHSKWLSFSNISIDPLQILTNLPNLITLHIETLSSLKITKKNNFRWANSIISLILKHCSKFCNVSGDHLVESLSYKWHDEHSVLWNAHSYFCKFFFDYVWLCLEKVLPQNRNLRFSNAQPEGRTSLGSTTVPKSILCAKEKGGTDASGEGTRTRSLRLRPLSNGVNFREIAMKLFCSAQLHTQSLIIIDRYTVIRCRIWQALNQVDPLADEELNWNCDDSLALHNFRHNVDDHWTLHRHQMPLHSSIKSGGFACRWGVGPLKNCCSIAYNREQLNFEQERKVWKDESKRRRRGWLPSSLEQSCIRSRRRRRRRRRSIRLQFHGK